MKYGIVFLLVAGILIYYGGLIGGWGWLLLWPALSFSIVALAYLGSGVKVFGKRRDGTIAWYSLVGLLPYFLFVWAVWHLLRLVRSEPSCHEIRPGLYVGRRPFAHELPPQIEVIVDLTAEFPEPAAVRSGRRYLCLPTLDALVPSDSDFRNLLEEILPISQPMYIHCAEGHGRSGTLAAAILVLEGLAQDVDEAITKLQAVRPGIGLRKEQKALVTRVCGDRAR